MEVVLVGGVIKRIDVAPENIVSIMLAKSNREC